MPVQKLKTSCNLLVFCVGYDVIVDGIMSIMRT
jgi:hypothetical protein